MLEEADRGPATCEWEITLACDLSCEHCCARAGRPRARELSGDEALSLAAQIAGTGCRAVTLTGGEPLLRKDWQRIAGELSGRGVFVAMSTSGSALDREAARAMRSAGVAAASVSLDGTEGTHDRIRGHRGSFRSAIRAVGLLAEAGIDAGLTTTVTRRNRADLERMPGTVKDSGASFWKVIMGAPSGLSRRGLWIGPAGLPGLAREIADLQRSSPVEVIPGDDLGCWAGASPFRAPRSTKPRRWDGCQAGRSTMGILSDGLVTGCLGLSWHGHRGPAFVEGDSRRVPLPSIWTRPGAFALARAAGPGSMAGACAACARAAACGGGCLWIADVGPDGRVENAYCDGRIAREARSAARCGAIAGIPAALALGIGLAAGGCGHGDRDAKEARPGPEMCLDEPPPQAQPAEAQGGCDEPAPAGDPGQGPAAGDQATVPDGGQATVPDDGGCKPDPCCYMRMMVPNCNCCWGDHSE